MIKHVILASGENHEQEKNNFDVEYFSTSDIYL